MVPLDQELYSGATDADVGLFETILREATKDATIHFSRENSYAFRMVAS